MQALSQRAEEGVAACRDRPLNLGLIMAQRQAPCQTLGRTMVGRPFNPLYLLLFFEVVGGKATDQAALDWALTFYRLEGRAATNLDQFGPALKWP